MEEISVLTDCERKFGMRKTHLSATAKCFGSVLFSLSQQYLFNSDIWHHRMAYYGELVAFKCGHIFTNIWWFIDGTIHRTCCPILHQELLYTQYKRCHGLKFQSIVTPDGCVACLYGPFVAKRHDSRMYCKSGVREELQTIMPEDESNGPVYAFYGDLAYPQSIWLLGGFGADRWEPTTSVIYIDTIFIFNSCLFLCRLFHGLVPRSRHAKSSMIRKVFSISMTLDGSKKVTYFVNYLHLYGELDLCSVCISYL
jgi:DDE superfamily endonuclease